MCLGVRHTHTVNEMKYNVIVYFGPVPVNGYGYHSVKVRKWQGNSCFYYGSVEPESCGYIFFKSLKEALRLKDDRGS